MNQVQATAYIDTLQNQRNQALNAVAQSEANNAGLRDRITELEKALAAATVATKDQTQAVKK
jgi:hypothetical protein